MSVLREQRPSLKESGFPWGRFDLIEHRMQAPCIIVRANEGCLPLAVFHRAN